MSTLSNLQKCGVCRQSFKSTESVPHNSQSEKNYQRFSALVSRYLKVISKSADLRSKLNVLSSLEIGKYLCDNCAPLAGSFCQMYDDWFNLELQMNHCLDEISKLIVATEAIHDGEVTVIKEEFPSETNQYQSCDILGSGSRSDFPEPVLRQVAQSGCKSFPLEKSAGAQDSLSRSYNNEEETHDAIFGDVKLVIGDDQLREDDESQEDYFGSEEPFDVQDENLSTNDVCHDVIIKDTDRIVLKTNKYFDSIIKLGVTEGLVDGGNTQQHVKAQHHLCPYCGKLLAHKRNLLAHIRVQHMGVKPFFCVLCKKYSEKRSNHERHVRSHTKERPYVCQTCLQEFTSEPDLRDHKKVLHLGDMIKCRYCDRTFDLKTSRRSHERTKHWKDYEACINKGPTQQ